MHITINPILYITVFASAIVCVCGVHVYMHLHMFVCAFAYVWVHVYVHVCVRVCVHARTNETDVKDSPQ